MKASQDADALTCPCGGKIGKCSLTGLCQQCRKRKVQLDRKKKSGELRTGFFKGTQRHNCMEPHADLEARLARMESLAALRLPLFEE